MAGRVAQAKKVTGEQEQAGAMLAGALAARGVAGSVGLDVANAQQFAADGITQQEINDELGETFTRAKSDGAYYGKQFLDAANSGDISGMNAAMLAMKNSNMKDKDIAKLLRFVINHGQIKGISVDQQIQWMKDTQQKYGNSFLATDFELTSRNLENPIRL